MFSKVVLCVAFYVASVSANPNPFSEISWPEHLDQSFPYRTCSPITIDTSCARPANFSTPLTLTAPAEQEHVLTNTGSEVTLTNCHPSETYLQGGVLGDDSRYIFERLDYFWSCDRYESSTALIDGVGAPVEISSVFRNLKYSSFQEALRHRDGLAIVRSHIEVEGYYPNPAYETLVQQLGQIRRGGSSIRTSCRPIFSSFDETSAPDYYYAYPGSYIDLDHGRVQYDCATIIVAPRSCRSCISIPQFQAFRDLSNGLGFPYTNTLTPVPRGIRPLIEAHCGFEVEIP